MNLYGRKGKLIEIADILEILKKSIGHIVHEYLGMWKHSFVITNLYFCIDISPYMTRGPFTSLRIQSTISIFLFSYLKRMLNHKKQQACI